MKVLYVHSGYPNFSEAFILNELNHLVQLGAQVQVLNLNFKKGLRQSGIRYNTLNPLKFGLGKGLIKASDFRGETLWRRKLKQCYMYFSSGYLIRTAKEFDPDVILSHFAFSTSKIASELALRLNVPHHLRLHTTYSSLQQHSLNKPIKVNFLRQCNISRGH